MLVSPPNLFEVCDMHELSLRAILEPSDYPMIVMWLRRDHPTLNKVQGVPVQESEFSAY